MYSVPWAGSQQQPSAAAYGGYHGQQQYMLPPAMYYSIDVECVAVGADHNARAVAQISLVVRARLIDICLGLQYVLPRVLAPGCSRTSAWPSRLFDAVVKELRRLHRTSTSACY